MVVVIVAIFGAIFTLFFHRGILATTSWAILFLWALFQCERGPFWGSTTLSTRLSPLSHAHSSTATFQSEIDALKVRFEVLEGKHAAGMHTVVESGIRGDRTGSVMKSRAPSQLDDKTDVALAENTCITRALSTARAERFELFAELDKVRSIGTRSAQIAASHAAAEGDALRSHIRTELTKMNREVASAVAQASALRSNCQAEHMALMTAVRHEVSSEKKVDIEKVLEKCQTLIEEAVTKTRAAMLTKIKREVSRSQIGLTEQINGVRESLVNQIRPSSFSRPHEQIEGIPDMTALSRRVSALESAGIRVTRAISSISHRLTTLEGYVTAPRTTPGGHVLRTSSPRAQSVGMQSREDADPRPHLPSSPLSGSSFSAKTERKAKGSPRRKKSRGRQRDRGACGSFASFRRRSPSG